VLFCNFPLLPHECGGWGARCVQCVLQALAVPASLACCCMQHRCTWQAHTIWPISGLLCCVVRGDASGSYAVSRILQSRLQGVISHKSGGRCTRCVHCLMQDASNVTGFKPVGCMHGRHVLCAALVVLSVLCGAIVVCRTQVVSCKMPAWHARH
jgi:hypothetical protein